VTIAWKLGVEVELLAPRGSSRRVLAERLAAEAGGRVAPFFHAQSEPSLVPGTPVFENLTLGFEVWDAAGAPVARCVDDVTLQDDLERAHAPAPGWFRVVGDDARLLELVARHGRADGGLVDAVAPVAALFGSEPELLADGSVRVVDRCRRPVAIATHLPGERERPCELVTPPMERDHGARLAALLAPARELGFTVPREAAVHVHFDARRLRTPRAVRSLVRLVDTYGPALKARVGTNARCRRLGGWPEALRAVVEAPEFVELAWPDAQARLARVGLTKYCDVNLRNVVHDVPDKPTVEVRVLPGAIEEAPIVAGAALFAAVMELAVSGDVDRAPEAGDLAGLLRRLPAEVARAWR
jgi:hypothetical protein